MPNFTRSKVEVNVYNNKIQIRVQQSESDACTIVPPERKNIGDACTLAYSEGGGEVTCREPPFHLSGHLRGINFAQFCRFVVKKLVQREN
jgi:hypothetical protein